MNVSPKKEFSVDSTRGEGACSQPSNDYPLTPIATIGTAIKHPVPDRVKPSFVILDIRAL